MNRWGAEEPLCRTGLFVCFAGGLGADGHAHAKAGDLVQLGEVMSEGSYLSQHDLRIHFGLGHHERVNKAEILWPDGKRELLEKLAADRFYFVREGQRVVAVKAP